MQGIGVVRLEISRNGISCIIRSEKGRFAHGDAPRPCKRKWSGFMQQQTVRAYRIKNEAETRAFALALADKLQAGDVLALIEN